MRLVVCLLLVAFGASSALPWSEDSSAPSILFILGDDIGWADFSYNNGTAQTPHIDEWARSNGSIRFHDFHSGGTVCSPTRATVLTGRNHFRDCVNSVYGCSDMTECVPKFEFAPQRTFTVADAVRAASKDFSSLFVGKWHLGSFYNDSEKYGGRTSSPITHGFDHMNATVEVAPTASTNCQCREDWDATCDFGHYKRPNHCSGGTNPGGADLPKGCCFNYWREDSSSPHGVSNMSTLISGDDSQVVAGAFVEFLHGRRGRPFFAQLSFHNCHIPYIGSAAARQNCTDGRTCRAENGRGGNLANYSDAQLDFYACLAELDASVGKVLSELQVQGYYENTMVWFTTDNGPEGDCGPEGLCGDKHYLSYPGDAGPLRGRKRDIWEGGHRVPGIISWPAVVKGPARESWDLVVTMDFLATVMDVLGVQRPKEQEKWAFDGKSLMPILRGESWAERGIGWMYMAFNKGAPKGYRYGNWKYVHGTRSCSSDDCKKELLYDLSVDLGERHDVSGKHPAVLAAIRANFTEWYASVANSRANESQCGHHEDLHEDPGETYIV